MIEKTINILKHIKGPGPLTWDSDFYTQGSLKNHGKLVIVFYEHVQHPHQIISFEDEQLDF